MNGTVLEGYQICFTGEERGAGKVQLTTNLRRNYQTFCSNFVVFSHENNPSTCQTSLTRYNMKVGCDSLYKNTSKSDEFSDTDILKDSWERENLFRI